MSLHAFCTRSADLLRGTYVRATGPIDARAEEHVSDEDGTRTTTYVLRADGKKFTLSSENYATLSNVSWGTLEYARSSRIIFRLRSETGETVISHRRYSR
jgi:hypothetical protein